MTKPHCRVLVVDDEVGLLHSLQAFLEDEDFETIGVMTGEEALKTLTRQEIDVAIMDMRLPGIDGNEVILKSHEMGLPTRFIIHTGSADYQLPQSLIDIGFDEKYIFLKPLSDLSVLSTAILTLL